MMMPPVLMLEYQRRRCSKHIINLLESTAFGLFNHSQRAHAHAHARARTHSYISLFFKCFILTCKNVMHHLCPHVRRNRLDT